MKVEHLEDKSSYNIRFTNKIKESIKSLSKKYKKVAIVTDKNIWSIYSGTLKNKDVLNILIRPGEKSKSILVKNYIEENLLENNFNRKSVIIGVGGGVIGDLVGFTASTFMRGIDLIHIPTTLVSIVDSSIGGKTAIDNKYGKNLIGTFYNPKEILIDLNFLSSLPSKEIRQGMAEIIKYSIIDNKQLFKTLKTINTNLLSNNKSIIQRIIKTCMQIKIKTIKSFRVKRKLRGVEIADLSQKDKFIYEKLDDVYEDSLQTYLRDHDSINVNEVKRNFSLLLKCMIKHLNSKKIVTINKNEY